jgi:hypothetical protein
MNQIIVDDDINNIFKKEEDTLFNKITYYLWRAWYNFLDIPYYLKQRFIRKHHIVKTTLNPWTWHETDTRLLYCTMALLEDFFVKQISMDIVCWDSDEEHKHARKEMDEIRAWWKNYDNRQKEIDNALTEWSDEFKGFGKKQTPKEKELMNKLHDMEVKLNEEEKEMMKRLVDIRSFLWT